MVFPLHLRIHMKMGVKLKQIWLLGGVLLLASCGAKSNSGTNLAAGTAQELAVLKKVVLGAEYNNDGTVYRYTQIPSISIFQGNSTQQNIVNYVIGQLNSAFVGTSFRVKLAAPNDASAQIHVYFAPMGDFPTIANQNGFQYVSGNSGFFSSNWNNRHEIQNSVVMIATDVLTLNQQISVALEEMSQCMGPGGDQSVIKDSIFYETDTDPGYAMAYSTFDKRVLRLLYGHLQPGDRETQLVDAFNNYW